MAISFKSINVRGLRKRDKRKATFSEICSLNCDICFLQETHWTSDMESTIQSEWRETMLCNNGSSMSAGTAMLFTKTLEHSDYWCDNIGRIQAANIKYEGKTICVVNIYAPNKDSEQVSSTKISLTS